MSSLTSAGQFVCDAWTVAWHLREFFATGKRDLELFELWRSLHCRSNGLTTDIFNKVIEFGGRKANFATVDGIAGSLAPDDRLPILSALDKDGLYIFPELVDDEIVDRLCKYAFSHKSEAYPALPGKPTEGIFDGDDPISPTCWHPQRDLFSDQTVQDLVCDTSLLALASEYLRVVPRLTTLALWHSSHKFPEADGTSAQMFHFDMSQPRWLKFFVYLTDVTPQSGPHAFVKGSHRRDEAGAHLRARGIQRIPDRDIEQCYPSEKIVEISAPKGTLFAADTRAWHKGIKPLTQDRLVFQIEYSNCTYSNPIDEITAPAASGAVERIWREYPEVFERFRLVFGDGVGDLRAGRHAVSARS